MSEALLSENLASRAKFASLMGIAAAATAAHLAGLMRVHHLPFIEGIPQEFHPEILKAAAFAFVAFLFFALASAVVLPVTRELLWRRLILAMGASLWPVAAMLADREMTGLLEGVPTPGWAAVLGISAAVAVGALVILQLADVLDAAGIASRTAWAFAAIFLCASSYYFSLNAALDIFNDFGLALQITILSTSVLAVLLGVIIMRRKSARWASGIGLLFGLILISSLPWSLDGFSLARASAVTTDVDKPRNIILLTVDTMRPDMLACYGGSSAPPTPNFDALAKDSVMFMNAATAAPWTLPSMSALFSGEDPRVHQCVNLSRRLPDHFKRPAEYFSEAGYDTRAIVHNVFLGPSYGFAKGFHEFKYVNSITSDFVINPLRRNPFLRPRHYDFSSTSLLITVETIRYLRRMKDDRPFFLWIHFFDPHKPYIPPERYLDEAGRRSSSDLQGAFAERTPENEAAHRLNQLSRYKGEIRFVDECVGRIMRELKTQGIYDSSLIAFTSDHGEEFYEHGGYGHSHTLYEELLHVPLFWKSPDNLNAGRKVRTRVPMPAVRTALLDAMGFVDDEKSEKYPSFLSLIEASESSAESPPLLGGSLDPSLLDAKSVIASEWKYIEWARDKPPELYNLAEDPGEQMNLFQSHPKEAANMKLLLAAQEVRLEKRKEALAFRPEDIGHEPDEASRNELRDLGYIK